MRDGEPGLRVCGVTVRRRGVTVLDGADLTAQPATVTGLVGPDDAGAAALADVVCGLLRPACGSVHLDGADLVRRAPRLRGRRGVARTFRRPEVFRGLTVRENVLVAAQAHALTREVPGRSRRDRRRIRRAALREAGTVADALLERLGITAYAARRAGRVPPGVARLVELARALAADPRLLVLDEPSAGLSVPQTRALEVLLREVAAEGPAVLLIERDLELMMGVCDRLHLMRAGRVVASGSPFEVRETCRPRPAPVAGR
ncbi:ATP-binding cassette domain-containing protein [Actinomadura sp. NPDC047616]|uniref:ATP-binding cassette domain-containing protein n=1 Tax=Actinomadura sp. NPDC047616 TaxID=3155914 RepID=UPI0033D6E1B5